MLQHFYEASGCVVEEGDFKLWGTYPGWHDKEGIAGVIRHAGTISSWRG